LYFGHFPSNELKSPWMAMLFSLPFCIPCHCRTLKMPMPD